MIFAKAILLAIVEGLTEFLPVSSTGHMILVDKFLQLSSDEAFVHSFEVMVQLPAILAVVVYFWKDLWPALKTREAIEYIRSQVKTDPHGTEPGHGLMIHIRTLAEILFQGTQERFVLWSKIILAFLPAAVLGALLHKRIEEHLFTPLVVAITLFVGGIILILLEDRRRPIRILNSRDIGYKTALLIGVIQCIAMIPGTSRSAATIIGAMVLGASRFVAAEFSFFLAIPTMFGASAFVVMKHGLHFTREEWVVTGVAAVVSFVVAYSVVAFLMNYIRRHDFKPFGYYRIALAIIVFALLYF